MSDKREFTMGCRVTVDNPEHDEHLHMTLAYCGNEFPIVTASDFTDFKPFAANITGEAMLGPKKDIPVWTLKLTDDSWVKKMWGKFNIEQDHTKGLKEPFLLITKKRNLAGRNIGDAVIFSSFFVKQVGPHDPTLEIPF